MPYRREHPVRTRRYPLHKNIGSIQSKITYISYVRAHVYNTVVSVYVSYVSYTGKKRRLHDVLNDASKDVPHLRERPVKLR